MNHLSKVILGFFFLLSQGAFANDPSLDWKTLETAHFRIHYDKSMQSLAFETEVIAESVHDKLSVLLNWQPQDKTDLVLTDHTDFANGSATPLPRNRSTLIVQPPTDTSFDYVSWLESLIIHEYTHILHLDKTAGIPKALQNVFGRFVLLFPNIFQPNWFVEGLATYMETDQKRQIGRGQSSHFEMIMRMEVLQGIKPLSKVNVSNTQWPINQSYLYGEHFYRFIEESYGEDKVIQLSDEYADDLVPFFINRNADIVLNKNLTELWDEFKLYLHQRYQPQIEKITKNSIKQGKQITQDGFYTQTVEATPEGIYYIRKNAFEQTYLMFKTKSGDLKSISKINTTASLDWHPVAGLLVSQPEICDEFNVYFDLYQLKPGSTSLQRLTTCGRYRQARWSARGDFIVALKSTVAKFQFDQLNPQGELKKTLWRGQYGEVISQFDLSPDDQELIAAIRDNNSPRVQLKQLDLITLQWHPVIINQTKSNQVNHQYPRYSHNGKNIYFSADYNGVYNLYEFNRSSKDITRLSNVLGGVFQSSQAYNEIETQTDYYYAGYHANGYDIYHLDSSKSGYNKELNKVSKLNINSPVNHTITSNKKTVIKQDHSKISDYSPWGSLMPAYWFPFAASNEVDTILGAQTSGSDALGIHLYNLSLAANFDKNVLFGGAAYVFSNKLQLYYNKNHNFGLSVNGASTYLTEDDFEVSLHLPMSKIQSQWNFKLGVASTRAELGTYINQDFQQTSDYASEVVGLGFSFNSSQRYFKSISQSSGREVHFIAESSDLLSSDFSGEVYSLDWREFYQLHNEHTLALRFVQGWGTDNPQPFRLGGTDSSAYLLTSNHFNERSYALRGYPFGLNFLSGRRMQLASIEYRFPITRIEKTMMAPPIGLGSISGSLFAEAGTAYDGKPENYYSSIGFEFRSILTLGYALPLELTFGYASGKDDGGINETYFRLGRSF